MKEETFIRRALFAPIIIPVLASPQLMYWNNPIGGNPNTPPADLGASYFIALFLLISLGMGGIPYLWMLYAKREVLFHTNGKAFREACLRLPITMLKYYWMFWGVVTVLLSPTGWGWQLGLGCLVYGTIAVPLFGFAYCILTLVFLRILQAINDQPVVVEDNEPLTVSVMPIGGK